MKRLDPLSAIALAVLIALFSGPAEAQEEADDTQTEAIRAVQERLAQLPPAQRDFVVRAQGLMTPEELQYFLGLEQDYRRNAFVDAFWRVRDPDSMTSRNELRERFEEITGRNPGATTADPRVLAYLLNGPPGRWTLPDGRNLTICYSRTGELEIWFYGGSERVRERVPIVFLQRNRSQPYEVWRPGSSVRTARRSRLPTQNASQLCAEDLFRYATQEIGTLARYDQLLEQMLQPPQVSTEWLATFRGSTTEMPAGARQFEAQAKIRFPARNQSRTVVEVELQIDRRLAPGRVFSGRPHHDFRVVGEVLRDGELFETFDYRFEGPSPPRGETIPIGFRRSLRPGPVELELLVHDVYGDQYAHFEASFEVPSPTGRPPIERPTLSTALGEDGRPALELLSPAGGLLSGKQRFTARAGGDFDRVAFLLDGRQVFSKRTPPYSVELDLGELPEPRRIRVVGYRGEREVATDQLWVNQGNQRLRVELVEPREGGVYPGSLTARAEVRAPGGETPAAVEFFVGDRSVAELLEPPYTAAIELPGAGAAVVRVVATLADGTSAEEAVVVNAGLVERVEVTAVEVPVVVLDGTRPVAGLDVTDFTLLVDGTPQAITSFQAAGGPLELALLVDRSSSMQDQSQELISTSTEFATGLLETSDVGAATTSRRVAVLSFADTTRVEQTLTSSPEAVTRALASLRPLGGTALYDALLVAMNELQGAAGGALVVFSDGRDENSRFTRDDVLEAAQRRGVQVYAVVLDGSGSGGRGDGIDPALDQLCAATGGRAFVLQDLGALERVYSTIAEELSNRYLLTYEPSAGDNAAQAARLEVQVRGADEQGWLVRSRTRVDR